MSYTLKLLIGVLALLIVPSLSACNTARGIGQDIQAAGRAITGTSEEVEEEMTSEPDAAEEGATQ